VSLDDYDVQRQWRTPRSASNEPLSGDEKRRDHLAKRALPGARERRTGANQDLMIDCVARGEEDRIDTKRMNALDWGREMIAADGSGGAAGPRAWWLQYGVGNRKQENTECISKVQRV
jgi:hypothetical protein